MIRSRPCVCIVRQDNLFDRYTVVSVEWWYVLLRNGYPVAQGSLDTIRLHPCYKCAR